MRKTPEVITYCAFRIQFSSLNWARRLRAGYSPVWASIAPEMLRKGKSKCWDIIRAMWAKGEQVCCTIFSTRWCVKGECGCGCRASDMMLQPPRGREVSFYEWEGRGKERDGTAQMPRLFSSFLWMGGQSDWGGLKCGGYIFMNGEDSEWYCAGAMSRFLWMGRNGEWGVWERERRGEGKRR